jgi:Ca2+-binding EF-hand superfamily protein
VAQGAFVSRVGTLDSSLSRANLLSIWKNVDATNAGVVELGTIHNILATKYGKDSGSTKNNGVIERVVAKILERCAGQGGIKGLQRTLAIMDDNGDKKLSKDELKFGLQDYGIQLNIREMDDIFTFFDRDRNGFIDITEFFVGIKGDLSEKRTKLVRLAFDILDRDRSGVVTLDELLEVYDVTKVPDVVSGKKTPREAIKEFSAHWDRENNDGLITCEEFLEYYKEISASIDGDDYFELMIRNAWRIPGGEGFAANTANKRVLVTNRDGSQRVETVHNELGMKPGDREAVRARLAQQGVKDVEVELYGGVDNTTKAANNQRPPARIGGRSGAQAQSPKKAAAPTSLQSNRNTFERHAAALKLAAAFRGRLARKQALVEKRKKDANDREQKEVDDELNRAKPKTILRPKGKSYIGF